MSLSLTPQRILDLDGAYEIRDTGGYATRDGRQTRWKTLLRSANLDQLPPESQQALIDYGVRTVIDLRKPSELELRPDVFAGSTKVNFRHHDMVGEDLHLEIKEAVSTHGLGPYIGRWLHETTLKILDRRHAEVCAALTTLVQPGGLPAIVHCSAGKGRTGLIIAMVLDLAGVPAETIAEDYAVTAAVRWRRRTGKDTSPGDTEEGRAWEDYLQISSPPSAMLKTLDLIEHRYGGVEAYVKDGGVTNEQIRRIRKLVVA